MPTAILIAILIKMAEMWRRSRIENPETETQGSRNLVARLANRQISVQTSETNYQYQDSIDQLSTQESMTQRDLALVIRKLDKLEQQFSEFRHKMEKNIKLLVEGQRRSDARLSAIEKFLSSQGRGFMPCTDWDEQSRLALKSQMNIPGPKLSKSNQIGPIDFPTGNASSKLGHVSYTLESLIHYWFNFRKSIQFLVECCEKNHLKIDDLSQLVSYYLYTGPKKHYQIVETQALASVYFLMEKRKNGDKVKFTWDDKLMQTFQKNTGIQKNIPYKQQIDWLKVSVQEEYPKFLKQRDQNEFYRLMQSLKIYHLNRSQKYIDFELPLKEKYYIISIFLQKKPTSIENLTSICRVLYSDQIFSIDLIVEEELASDIKYLMKKFPH